MARLTCVCGRVRGCGRALHEADCRREHAELRHHQLPQQQQRAACEEGAVRSVKEQGATTQGRWRSKKGRSDAPPLKRRSRQHLHLQIQPRRSSLMMWREASLQRCMDSWLEAGQGMRHAPGDAAGAQPARGAHLGALHLEQTQGSQKWPEREARDECVVVERAHIDRQETSTLSNSCALIMSLRCDL